MRTPPHHRGYPAPKPTGVDYQKLYGIALSIMRQCAGPAHTPIQGWDSYIREEAAERKPELNLQVSPSAESALEMIKCQLGIDDQGVFRVDLK
jgi:hypothetical protein